jgi:hypothetical protein
MSTPQPSSSSSRPPPVNNFVSMTPEDINILIRGVMTEQKKLMEQERAAIQAATLAQPTTTDGTTTATTNDGRGLKFADQPSFNGKPENLDPMLREAEVHFSVQDQLYNTPT